MSRGETFYVDLLTPLQHGIIHFRLAHTWHADACELPDAVQAGGVVLAGHGQALVDVDLTARPGVSSATLTLEGALCVHTLPKVLTGVGTLGWKEST